MIVSKKTRKVYPIPWNAASHPLDAGAFKAEIGNRKIKPDTID
jgi:hypothetical protein